MEDSQKAGEGGKVFRPYVKSEDEIKNDQKKEQENFKKGIMAEKSFKDFLNDNKIPFYYIDQSKDSFSKVFQIKNIKRPDYIVYTEKGVFHIDVKCRKKYSLVSKEEKRFSLKQNDIEKLYNFYNKLHSDTWVAFTGDENPSKFFYAPISKIYNYYIYIVNGIKEKCSKEDYYEEFHWVFRDFCPIHIPETFLYNSLSFEKGFHQEPNWNFSETDIIYHINKAWQLTEIKYKQNININFSD